MSSAVFESSVVRKRNAATGSYQEYLRENVVKEMKIKILYYCCRYKQFKLVHKISSKTVLCFRLRSFKHM